ncbi:hypothetical protein D3C72_2184400 [compost metagenome]
MAADITGTDRPQQRIAHRVQHHITVGVGQQPLFVRHRHPAQHAGANPAKSVYIKTMSNADHDGSLNDESGCACRRPFC